MENCCIPDIFVCFGWVWCAPMHPNDSHSCNLFPLAYFPTSGFMSVLTDSSPPRLLCFSYRDLKINKVIAAETARSAFADGTNYFLKVEIEVGPFLLSPSFDTLLPSVCSTYTFFRNHDNTLSILSHGFLTVHECLCCTAVACIHMPKGALQGS